jgi:hypothetical protein
MLRAHRYLPALLLAASVAFVAPAYASRTYAYRNGYPAYAQVERRAYSNGYKDGFDRGRQDVRSRRPYTFDRYGEYRDADRGYRRSDGDHDVYRRSFRQGFAAGYQDAFSQGGGARRR